VWNGRAPIAAAPRRKTWMARGQLERFERRMKAGGEQLGWPSWKPGAVRPDTTAGMVQAASRNSMAESKVVRLSGKQRYWPSAARSKVQAAPSWLSNQPRKTRLPSGDSVHRGWSRVPALGTARTKGGASPGRAASPAGASPAVEASTPATGELDPQAAIASRMGEQHR